MEEEHYKARANGSKDRTELENLILAWKHIQELDPSDRNSFYCIGGYHGEPFRGVSLPCALMASRLTIAFRLAGQTPCGGEAIALMGRLHFRPGTEHMFSG